MRAPRGTLLLGFAVVACGAWLAVYSMGTVGRAADRTMRREVERGHFSGTVLVSQHGRVIFSKGYGLADADWDVPNSPDTRFEIGSITKTFTATLILQLEQQHKLALTDPLCAYLDTCPAAWARVTLHHLLSHTSGIYNLTQSPDFSREHVARQTREQILARIDTQPLAFAPGAQFEYSNSNYYLLAMVIERVTGQSYESVLQQRILGPLGMHDTGVIHRDSILPHHATGYRPGRSGAVEVDSPIDESWSFGAGSLYSTVGDLEKWNNALDSDAVLPKTTLARMWQPVKGEYGYGWELPSVTPLGGNRRIVQHTGSVTGFAALFQRLPDEQLTIIVLSNTLWSQPSRVARSLRAVVLGERYVPTFDREAIPFTPEMLERYVGDYELGGEIYTLRARSGRLYVGARDNPQFPQLEILAASPTDLYLRDIGGEMTATVDGQGRVSGFLLNQDSMSRVVRRVR